MYIQSFSALHVQLPHLSEESLFGSGLVKKSLKVSQSRSATPKQEGMCVCVCVCVCVCFVCVYVYNHVLSIYLNRY